MDEIIIPILGISLAWLAVVAYTIYKDHGVVEHIDGTQYIHLLKGLPAEDGEVLDLRERLRKRFEK